MRDGPPCGVLLPGFEAEQEALFTVSKVAEGMAHLLSLYSQPGSPFAVESAALARDLGLQLDIIRAIEPAFGHFVGGKCTARRCHPRLDSCLPAAGNAFILLCRPQLSEGLMHRAAGSPPLLELLWTTVDHVLLQMPDTDLSEGEREHRARLLSSASAVMCTILSAQGWGQSDGRGRWVIPHVRHAAAVLAEMLRQDAGPSAVCTALLGLDTVEMYKAQGPGLPLALSDDCVGATAAAEACVRLAAQEGEIRRQVAALLPTDRMGDLPKDNLLLRAGTIVIAALSQGVKSAPPSVLSSHAALNAVASLVDSFAKVGHVYAELAAGGQPWWDGYCAVCSCAGYLRRLVEGLGQAAFNPGSQGVAQIAGPGLTR